MLGSWLHALARLLRRGAGRELRVYCDGSAHEVAGRAGGWAFVVVQGDEVLRTGQGSERAATSSQMELRAALEGLRAVRGCGFHPGDRVELLSDCRLAVDVAKGLEHPVKDAELAGLLRAACLELGATPRWIRGHAGLRWNEHVDRLAHEAKQHAIPLRVRRKAEQRRLGSTGPRRRRGG